MKLIYLALLSAAAITSASATTIIAQGGTNGFDFGFTVTGSGTFTPFTATGPNTATLSVGTFENNLFTQFAPADTTPPSFGDSGPLAGKWLGSAGDDSAAANAFTGDQIWFRVIATVNGTTYTGYFADSGVLFPANDGGIDDVVGVSSSNLDTVSPNSTGNWTISNGRVSLSVIPEPSSMLLGGIGTLLLLRRRR